jgi:hypothetical protein
MNSLYDLIYCPRSLAKDLLTKYPDAIIEDASDDIHPERFSIRVEDTKKNYFKNVILSGIFEVSFLFQMAMRKLEDFPELKEAAEELKQEENNERG